MSSSSSKLKDSTIYALQADFSPRTKVVILIQTDEERTPLGLVKSTKEALRKFAFSKVELVECSLDQCRRLLDCDCRGLYDPTDR